MCSDFAIRIEGVSKEFALYASPADRLKAALFPRRIHARRKQAVRGVTLDIARGETVALVGRNGSGKSTLLQLVCGTLTPSSGAIATQGRISALLELGAGFDPELSGLENLKLNAAILGLTPAEIAEKQTDILTFADIGEAISQPVKTYSSGMTVRLAFAIAVAVDPDILVVDEALAVGDEAFQRKCFARIRDLQQKGCTILLVSHAAAMVLELADRAVLMEQGEMKAEGKPKAILDLYHKLLYAPKEKEEALLAQFAAQVVALDVKPEQFAPEMLSESRVEYESHGAFIEDPRLETTAGEPINLLTRGQEVVYRYRVRFEAEARQVRCGMMLKTVSGLELGGASTATAFGNGIEAVKKGDVLEVAFRFTAALNPGVYFLNCGCSGMVGDRMTFLHRITDAVLFKVVAEGPQTSTGTVDFGVVASVTQKT